jgi:predicted  nucleic acid-binding Zn-ribbon protein
MQEATKLVKDFNDFTYAMNLAKTSETKQITQQLNKELDDAKREKEEVEKQVVNIRASLEQKMNDQAALLEQYRAQIEMLSGSKETDSSIGS